MNGGQYRVVWRRAVIERRVAGFMLELVEAGESTEPLFLAMNRIDEVLGADPAPTPTALGSRAPILNASTLSRHSR